MKKRIAIATTIIAAVGTLAAAPFVLAERAHARFGHHAFAGHGFGFGPLGHLGHIKDELDLTDEQTARIRAIFAEARQQNAAYREQLHGGYMDVAQALLANPNDVTGAQALIDRQLEAERALKANFLGAASKALAVLDAGQRAKLSTIIEEHERHGRRGR